MTDITSDATYPEECGKSLPEWTYQEKSEHDAQAPEVPTKFRYSFDLDNTLCDTEGTFYASAKPRPAMIALVNALHDAGHFVAIVTGRGWIVGNPSEEIIKAADQLKAWGCRYSWLGSRGPSDLLFDDRGVRVNRVPMYDWS